MALSCMFEYNPDETVISKYHLIFEGKVIKRIIPETIPASIFRPAGLYEFEVQRVWKGEAKTNIHVWASLTFDNYLPYEENNTYIVYAYKENGHYMTRPGFCGPDHVYSEEKMRTILHEYSSQNAYYSQNNMDVVLTLNENAHGTLTLKHTKGEWKKIAHPFQKTEALSFVVQEKNGLILDPINIDLKWFRSDPINLPFGESIEFSFSSLNHVKNDILHTYKFEEGKTYSISAIYRPFGTQNIRFVSNEVIITYKKPIK